MSTLVGVERGAGERLGRNCVRGYVGTVDSWNSPCQLCLRPTPCIDELLPRRGDDGVAVGGEGNPVESSEHPGVVCHSNAGCGSSHLDEPPQSFHLHILLHALTLSFGSTVGQFCLLAGLRAQIAPGRDSEFKEVSQER